MYLITDTTDLRDKTALKDSYAKFKNQTYDSKPQPTNDFSGGASNLGKVTKGKRFFAQLTVSNKTINGRKYNSDSVIASGTNGSWMAPYQRPLLKHHDSYSGETFGRIKDSFVINHATMNVSRCNDTSVLPQKALDYFKEKGAFGKGDNSTIVELDIKDAATAQRIIDGTYQTVSQSSCYEKMTCNICGEDYVGGNCNHYAGDTYEIKSDNATTTVTCVPEASGNVEPVELSIVNYPANDTSIFFVYDENDESQPSEPEKKDNSEKNSEKNSDNHETVISTDTITVTVTDNQQKKEDSMDPIKALLLDKTIEIKDEALSAEVKEFAKELNNDSFVKFLEILGKLKTDNAEEVKPEEKKEEPIAVENEEAGAETDNSEEGTAEQKTDETQENDEQNPEEEQPEEEKQPEEVEKDEKQEKAIEDMKGVFDENKVEDKAENLKRQRMALWFK